MDPAAPNYRPQFPLWPASSHPTSYLIAALAKRYSQKRRGAQMSDLVQRLDERDIAAVAAYYQQVKSALPASAAPAK